ncbi:hypothetical protein E2562_022972 [Oryza meyeriana var. granulata]|uniref:Uncharacterized protein n=1 Tax=Oryza meyeriana var. granulata TaxID=110450 RepID=A0A6G1D786_9ORYZ|nr:hypothetical protein E2562_022972 [Oryza meyeriana var. granulata]
MMVHGRRLRLRRAVQVRQILDGRGEDLITNKVVHRTSVAAADVPEDTAADATRDAENQKMLAKAVANAVALTWCSPIYTPQPPPPSVVLPCSICYESGEKGEYLHLLPTPYSSLRSRCRLEGGGVSAIPCCSSPARKPRGRRK